VRRIALETRSRTQLFVETFIASGENLDGRREELNQRYLRLLPLVEPLLENPRDMLSLMAVGNSLDHNMKWWGDEGVEIRGGLRSLAAKARVDERAVERLAEAREVAILLDNSGEAVIDLAAAIRMAEEGKRVTLVARDQVYEIDVDRRTVERLLAEVSQAMGRRGVPEALRIVGTGSTYPAPASPSMPPETVEALERADLVLSKGIANAEALLDSCNPHPLKTIVVLTAKCPPIARLFKASLGTSLAVLGYPCGLQTRIVKEG